MKSEAILIFSSLERGSSESEAIVAWLVSELIRNRWSVDFLVLIEGHRNLYIKK